MAYEEVQTPIVERSRLGYGFATIRDDEIAAEASGVPTLRLKLIATTLSGALMGMAGAPLPYYVGYLDPASGFNLAYAVNSIAMPVIGGTTTWVGPLIGAVLLGVLQQWVTVTISSAVNLLIVGILLVDFVVMAPTGIVGLVKNWRTASDNAAQPAVFGIFYVLNAAQIFYLHSQGTSAYLLEAIFWIILIYLAVTRGNAIGRPWLAALPVVGAFSTLYLLLSLTYVIWEPLRIAAEPAWLPWITAALNVACVVVGVAIRPSPSREMSGVPA